MNVTGSALAVLLLVVVLPAQVVPAGKPRADLVEYDKLVAEWLAARQAYAGQLTEQGKEVALPDGKAFGVRAIRLADQFAGEEAMPFLSFAVGNFGDEETVKAVVARVLQSHVKSPGLATILKNGKALTRFCGQEDVDTLLGRVIAESPHELPRAWAMYLQATSLQRDKGASGEDRAKAEQMLVEAQKLALGTLLAETLDTSKFLVDRFASPKFEKDRLQIGMEAPDIVGEDLDGVAFKLSDYRGKVVLLDYWGFW